MMAKKVLFCDVDTQWDFLNPEGRLYVPGAESITNNISEARRFALEHGYSIIASADWHSLTDEEISLTPDFRKTFPPHCLAGEAGSERVGYLGEIPTETVEIEKADQSELRRRVAGEQFHIVIRINNVNLFENPNTVELLELIQPRVVVVFGVALDVCVYEAVSGLLRWGKAGIVVLADAVKGLGIKKDEEVFSEFERKGVKISTISDLAKEF
jgi:nicotinamidase/pyrazinamidase